MSVCVCADSFLRWINCWCFFTAVCSKLQSQSSFVSCYIRDAGIRCEPAFKAELTELSAQTKWICQSWGGIRQRQTQTERKISFTICSDTRCSKSKFEIPVMLWFYSEKDLNSIGEELMSAWYNGSPGCYMVIKCVIAPPLILVVTVSFMFPLFISYTVFVQCPLN